MRLFIDGKRVINQWQGPANTEFTYTTDLGEGKHQIKMEYLDWFGAAHRGPDVGRREGPAARHVEGAVLEPATRERYPEPLA